jgi:hypothetical protein
MAVTLLPLLHLPRLSLHFWLIAVVNTVGVAKAVLAVAVVVDC